MSTWKTGDDVFILYEFLRAEGGVKDDSACRKEKGVVDYSKELVV